jgi:phage antirepressor YoqD-like protein
MNEIIPIGHTPIDGAPVNASTPVSVPFHQDAILCVPGNQNEFSIVFKATCESMGLQFEAQLKRLRRQPWAGVSIMDIPSRGGVQKSVCIDRRTFSMWLATIDTGRMTNKEAAAKIVLYQKEVCDVLDRHFLGTPEDNLLPLRKQPAAPQFTLVEALRTALNSEEGRLKEKEARVAAEAAADKLAGQVEVMAPKVKALDRIATSAGLLCVSDTAKTLGVGPQFLFDFMAERHWIFKRHPNPSWVGRQPKIDSGFQSHKMTTITRGDGSEKTVTQVLVTPKGVARLALLLAEAEAEADAEAIRLPA